MNKRNIYPYIRNTALTVVATIFFSLWQNSMTAGMWIGITMLCIGEWIEDITCTITSSKQQQAASNTTKGKDASIECPSITT